MALLFYAVVFVMLSGQIAAQLTENRMAPDPLQIALILCVPILGLAITCAAGLYVLRPLDRAAKKNKCPPRFTIVDFLALTAHLSVPLALFATYSRGAPGDQGALVVLAGFGCIAAALIWWGTVKTAARAGIFDPKKRFVMIALVVPLAFFAATVVGLLGMYLLVIPSIDHGPKISLAAYLFEFGMVVTLFICRRTVQWILEKSVLVDTPANPWAETDA